MLINPTTDELRELIRAELEARGWRKADLGRIVEAEHICSAVQVYKFLAGDCDLAWARAVAIAAELGLTVTITKTPED